MPFLLGGLSSKFCHNQTSPRRCLLRAKAGSVHPVGNKTTAERSVGSSSDVAIVILFLGGDQHAHLEILLMEEIRLTTWDIITL